MVTTAPATATAAHVVPTWRELVEDRSVGEFCSSFESLCEHEDFLPRTQPAQAVTIHLDEVAAPLRPQICQRIVPRLGGGVAGVDAATEAIAAALKQRQPPRASASVLSAVTVELITLAEPLRKSLLEIQ